MMMMMMMMMKSLERLSSYRNLNLTQNQHVCAICGGLEVAGDVISSRNLKSVESYMAANVEVGSSSRSE